MDDVEAERQPQHLAQEMALRSHPAGRVTVLAGIGLDQRDELFEVARGQRRIDDNDVERSNRQRDRREVLLGIERQLGEQRRVHDVGAERNEQRVAVRRRASGLRRADIAGRAGDVLHIKLLAEMLGELLRSKTREYVGRAAGLERHDDAHRPRRPRLRRCVARERRQRGGARQQLENLSARRIHGASLTRGANGRYGMGKHRTAGDFPWLPSKNPVIPSSSPRGPLPFPAGSIFRYILHFYLDCNLRSVVRIFPALLSKGRALETILRTERGVASRGSGSQPLATGARHLALGHYAPSARSQLAHPDASPAREPRAPGPNTPRT